MSDRLRLLLWSTFTIMLIFLLIDLKNFLHNGAPFVIDDDLLDKFKFYATLPGLILAFLVILAVYQNIHNYDYFVMESIRILASSLLYGWILKTILVRFILPRTPQPPVS